MATDWIPVCKGLRRKVEVLALSAQTGLSIGDVVLLLLDFWSWVDDESADGQLLSMTPQLLVQAVGGDEKFWIALANVGWLSFRTEGVSVPKFDRWLGRGAKRRLHDAERKRDVRKMSAEKTDEKRTTGQDRTLQRKTPLPPLGDKRTMIEEFEVFWKQYPRKASKDAARKAWFKLNPDERLQALLLQALQRQRLWEQWTKDRGQYIPFASTWLNQGRWEDSEPEISAKPPMETELERAARIAASRAEADRDKKEIEREGGGLSFLAETFRMKGGSD